MVSFLVRQYTHPSLKLVNKEDYNIKSLFPRNSAWKSTISAGVRSQAHSSRLTTVIELNAIKSFTTCVDEAQRCANPP